MKVCHGTGENAECTAVLSHRKSGLSSGIRNPGLQTGFLHGFRNTWITAGMFAGNTRERRSDYRKRGAAAVCGYQVTVFGCMNHTNLTRVPDLAEDREEMCIFDQKMHISSCFEHDKMRSGGGSYEENPENHSIPDRHGIPYVHDSDLFCTV